MFEAEKQQKGDNDKIKEMELKILMRIIEKRDRVVKTKGNRSLSMLNGAGYEGVLQYGCA